MSFVHPSFLWAFAVLLIPIIVHLFNFRRYKTIYFSSIQFIKKVDQETNSTKNIKHYLVLFTRLLAFSALVLAFAQPYIPTGENNKSADTILGIYLDNSYSMSAKGTNGNLFNHAKESLRTIISQQPTEQQYVLVTNELSGIEHRIITSAELLDRLELVSLSPIARPTLQPLKNIKGFLSNEGFKGNLQYVTLSDFQKTQELRTENLDTSAYYSFIQFAPQTTRNLFIDSVWFEQPFQRIGVNSTLNVRVNNFGDSPITNAEIKLDVGKTNRQALTDLPANESTIVSINFTNKISGFQMGQVEVIDEHLNFDNTYYFSYEVKESLSVIVINGTGAPSYPKNVYLTDDFYQVEEINIGQLQVEKLNEGDLIVLNGLESISSGLRTKLVQLSEQGKSICIIPGTSPDNNMYNKFLQTLQLPLLKKEVGQSMRIKNIASEYEFYRGMFNEEVDNIRMPPLRKHFNSSVYTDANFDALITMENNDVLFAATGNKSKIYMLYTSASDEFNDFSKSALFSAIMLRIGELSQLQQTLSLDIGSSSSFYPDIEIGKDEKVELTNGNYRFIPSMSFENERLSINVRQGENNQSITAGNYDILYKDQEKSHVALNFSRLESKLNYFSPEDIDGYLNSFGINNTSFNTLEDFEDIHQLSVEKPNEYWRILLTLALVLFIAEMMIVLLWKV